VDPNPFAPPRTTELDSPEPPPGPDAPELDEEAIQVLVSGGHWARWGALFGALCAGLSLFKLGTGYLRSQIAGWSAVVAGAYNALALVVAWLSWRYAASTRRLPSEEGAASEVMRGQLHLFAAYAGLALLVVVSGVVGLVVAYVAGRAAAGT